MAQRLTPMTESELAAIISHQIADSVLYEGSEQSGLGVKRSKARAYYNGEESLGGDAAVQKGRTKLVSRDVADVLGWIMAGLLRVFLGIDKVFLYEPRRQDAEDGAKQATDYINYAFLCECDGYRVIYAALWDALLYGNGIIKHWWDDTPEDRVETLTNMTELDYIKLQADPTTIEIIEHTARPDPQMGEAPGMMPAAPEAMPDIPGQAPDMPSPVPDMPGSPQMPPMPMTNGAAGMPAPSVGGMAGLHLPLPQLHDVKVKRRISNGRLRVVAVPPEEFRLDRSATMLNEEHVRFAAHVCARTRSSLIADGYDRDIVDELPASAGASNLDPAAQGRARSWPGDSSPDHSTDLVQIWECFIQVDFDGDGIAEWRRVVTGDNASERQILLNEEWGDDLPFTDLVPDPIPHQWSGNSLYEELGDIQRLKTLLLRGIVDNMRWVNNPMRQAPENGVAPSSLDKLFNPEFGATIFTRQGAQITDLPTPYIADKLAFGLEIADQIKEFRTGVSAATQSLDPQALVNQTATAVNVAATANYAKQEMRSRNIAEYGGLKRLGSRLLRLVKQNQDRPVTMKLRGEWVSYEPSGWDADMDVIVNVGLGTGSRDRDLAMLNAIATKQEMVVEKLGPMIAAQLGVGPDTVFKTYRQMVEAMNLKNSEGYFPEVSADQVKQILAQMQAKPDPQATLAQAQVELLHAQAQKAQVDAQAAMIKAQSEAHQAQADAQQPLIDMQQSAYEVERIKAQIENLRASAMANITKAGAIQSDAQTNQMLAHLDALDHLVSWKHEQQKIDHNAARELANMHQRVETPGVQ